MEKLLILYLSVFFFVSCSNNDSDLVSDFTSDILPVESVDIPDEFKLGETYPITAYYYRPSACYKFKEFYYLKEKNQYTLAPISYVFEEDNCEIENTLVEATFNFTVESNESHIFKFWQGKGEEEDKYLIFEIPVIE